MSRAAQVGKFGEYTQRDSSDVFAPGVRPVLVRERERRGMRPVQAESRVAVVREGYR